MSAAFVGFLVVALWAYGARRLLRYLRYFQQEEYDARRFFGWITRERIVERRGSTIAALAAANTALLPIRATSVVVVVATLAYLAVAVFEEDPRASGKLPLRLTQRASRIFALAVVLWVTAVAFIVWRLAPFVSFWVACVLLSQLSPAFLVLANALLGPWEARHQHALKSDAVRRLRAVKPEVVGITGSYGKTSTKHFLSEMLRPTGAPFCPGGSINTVMGITRVIRENLNPGHKYAIFEMGAYGEGSIRRLCEFLHPTAGIITAIGLMHLERFGSEEAIYRAKSELAWMLPERALLVLNGDDPNCRRLATEVAGHRRTLLYSMSDSTAADSRLMDVRFGVDGSTFEIEWNGVTYPARTRLVGRPILSNVLAAFTMACGMGADPEILVAVIRNLKPYRNRLEVVSSDGVTWIHDAYNSNPVGFTAALDVLRELPGTRRILMTPGMVELGPRQHAENRRIAAVAAGICDVVLVVGDVNRAALVEGIEEGQRKPDVHLLGDRDAALAELKSLATTGDVVLIENDLPDLYEARPVL